MTPCEGIPDRQTGYADIGYEKITEHTAVHASNLKRAKSHLMAVSLSLPKENAQYPFKSANQFTKNHPFLLIFVLHPWLNQLAIHNDSANNASISTRSPALRAFIQFTHNTKKVSAVCKEISHSATLADAARLLSGIVFLNVWPSDAYPSKSSERQPVPSWIYLNPRATHKVTWPTLRTFVDHNVGVDDFADNDY